MNAETLDSENADVPRALADVVARSLSPSATEPETRAQLMELLKAPKTPIDRTAYAWEEIVPGLKLHTLSEDPAKGIKSCLVWGAPGASAPRHDHGGDEVILVLEGRLKDDHGDYGPGEICRSKRGDVHQEHVAGNEDCICFVVYYGDLIPV